jgi:chromosome segregation ATPase
MRKTSRILIVAALVAGGALQGARAEPSSRDLDGLVGELAGVHQSLDQLVGLVGQLIRNQKVDVLLKRIEMRERRMAPLEAELLRAERQRSDLNVEVERMQEMVDDWEIQLRDAERDNDKETEGELSMMLSQVRHSLTIESGRRDELDRRMNELEGDLIAGRKALAILDDVLLDELEQIEP